MGLLPLTSYLQSILNCVLTCFSGFKTSPFCCCCCCCSWCSMMDDEPLPSRLCMAAEAAADRRMGAVLEVGELLAEPEPDPSARAAKCGGSLSPAAIRLSRSRRNLQAQMLTSSAWTGGVGMEFVVVLVGLRGGGGSALSLVVTGLPDVTAPAPAAVAGVPDVAVVLLLSKPLSDSVERDNSSSCWTPACDSRSSSCSRSCCSKRWTLRSSKTSLISRWN